jgi:hypothetical protein
MKTLRILFGSFLVVASLFSFGVSCTGGADRIDWLKHLDRPFGAVSRFGQCVANADRVIDTSHGPVAFGLALFFLLFAVMVLASKRRQPATAAQV